MLARKMAHIVHDDKTQNLTLLLCNLQLLLHDNAFPYLSLLFSYVRYRYKI